MLALPDKNKHILLNEKRGGRAAAGAAAASPAGRYEPIHKRTRVHMYAR